MRWCWRGRPVERGALLLAHDAGIAAGDAAPHRVLETLKRDLHRLQELGIVRRWRLVAEPGRSEPALRIESPRPERPESGMRRRPEPGQPVAFERGRARTRATALSAAGNTALSAAGITALAGAASAAPAAGGDAGHAPRSARRPEWLVRP
jgi:hypothetical protein